jgi:hypothetical protein
MTCLIARLALGAIAVLSAAVAVSGRAVSSSDQISILPVHPANALYQSTTAGPFERVTMPEYPSYALRVKEQSAELCDRNGTQVII